MDCKDCIFWKGEKTTDLGVCSVGSEPHAKQATDWCWRAQEDCGRPTCDVLDPEPEEVAVVICSCELCKHFATAEQGPLGTCRRYPRPGVLLDVKGCGEFKLKPETEHITE